jgi:hypothetical protein
MSGSIGSELRAVFTSWVDRPAPGGFGIADPDGVVLEALISPG